MKNTTLAAKISFMVAITAISILNFFMFGIKNTDSSQYLTDQEGMLVFCLYDITIIGIMVDSYLLYKIFKKA